MTQLQTLPTAPAPVPTPVSIKDTHERYEIINNERREKPPMAAREVWLASRLNSKLDWFADERSLGHCVTEMLFVLRNEPDRLHRRPDAAFVSYERWAADRPVPRTNAWDVVPNLAVEVVSRTNLAEEIPTRVRDYFEAGAQLVWVIYPAESQVYVFDSPLKVRILSRDDELEGGLALPDFRIPLTKLFPHERAE